MSGELPDLPDVGGAELPAGDTGGDDSYANDLGEAFARAEAAADGEDEGDSDSYASDLREAMQGGEDDPEAAWRRELSEFVKPHREALNALGKGKKHAIRALFRAEQRLRADPVGALRWLAAEYGVLPREGQPGQPGQPGQQHQPQQAPVPQQYPQEIVAAAGREIASFAGARDANGAPRFPHFEQVRHDMGILMAAADQAGLQLSLEEAYDRAVWGSPTIRAQLTRQQASAAAEAQRQAVAKAKAARTPKTASVAVPPADEDEGAGSYAEVLKMELQRARGRAA